MNTSSYIRRVRAAPAYCYSLTIDRPERPWSFDRRRCVVRRSRKIVLDSLYLDSDASRVTRFSSPVKQYKTIILYRRDCVQCNKYDAPASSVTQQRVMITKLTMDVDCMTQRSRVRVRRYLQRPSDSGALPRMKIKLGERAFLYTGRSVRKLERTAARPHQRSGELSKAS